MSLKVEAIKPAVGAIVHVDRSQILGKAVARKCLELIERHGVVVFPRAGLDNEEQKIFTDNLGASVSFTSNAPGSGDKSGGYNITLDPKINNEPEYVQGTFFWHLDGMPMANIAPPKASVLSCRRKSATGGQTEFASTFAAYDALSEEDKAEYGRLTVVHSLVAGVREVKAFDELQPHMRTRKAERPLVWTYPSGRKALLIGYTADEVVGWPKAEGRALFARLLEWAAQPAFSYRHQWQEGDLVVWDNCGALHRVIPYSKDSGRLMHRTSVAGAELAA
ncbi:TauD/TfdA dioxygenase family protein [Solimonas terrae]|uniref:TauD/TfdA family dioxygenase n=1 Tax=Solimonas terrae TaxID=1396819 RepID=A0A6M2BNT8_9GAMM|nr:TauD/TfdA family dioxygenase [Solimonas terrae]NGY04034.1 TauD/TfdA family dioxygenase [Solimonas terrae]